MTITRISPGVWELRTRNDTLIVTGGLHTDVNVGAKQRRDGWSDLPYGHPRADGRPTVECTCRHDCRCRACTAREPVVEALPRVGTSPWSV